MNKPAKKKSSGSANKSWIVGAIIAIVVGAAAVVAITTSGSDGPSSDGLVEQAAVSVAGDVLPAYNDGDPNDPALGMTAPVLTGKGFTGNTITTETTGTPMMLVFLAHWCPNCQREVPALVEWNKAGRTPPGIDIIGIATGTDPANPNYPPSEWLAREEFPALWPVIADSKDNTAGDAFGLAGYPYFVLIDGSGKVVKRMSGEIPMDELTVLLTALLPA
jgi:cytochrome c biogenesis protein CcmG, thiol:disulfide interchange protein DsbE